ncbi:MAG: methyltransferase domain-containing protein [Patescibacteria group bacterium]|jgi:ubiquinone/menaquinone biosynthesis C-methylase UbiE
MVYVSGGNELLNPTTILSRLGVKTGAKIADLGCGSAGHFVIPAAHLVGSQTTVYAVDILKSVLRSVTGVARLEGVNNIKPIWSNLEIVGATKIKPGSLDFTLLINNLFQTKKMENMIKEAIRLLKPEGKILIVDWNQVPASFGPSLTDRVKPEVVKKVAQSLGLNLVEEFAAGTYHYGLIFEK